MTRKEYYEILRKAWEKVNKENLEEIQKYNKMKEELRKQVD